MNTNENLDIAGRGYRIERELGHNSAGGRVTYLATQVEAQKTVVIKQFQFAQTDSTWEGYKAYQSEIQVLQQLNHPRIPDYLNSFETPTGFCLVQEYKNATSLSVPRHFSVAEIEQIAIAILDVLVYLQQQNPPIVHRDIKPDNILVDRADTLNVYLVDFGFARMGGGDVAVSSVVKGTLGFMPPEQILNRQLTEASDLYSLGMTLICLLTQTKSAEVGNLIDEAFCVNVKQLLPHLNPGLVRWLEKMISPNIKNRYPNAKVARYELSQIEQYHPQPVESVPANVSNQEISEHTGLVYLSGIIIAVTISYISLYSVHSLSGSQPHNKKENIPVDIITPPPSAFTSPSTELDNIKQKYFNDCKNNSLKQGDIKKPVEVLVMCDLAVQNNPNSSEVWYFRGVALMYQEHYEEAIADFDRALELPHNNLSIWMSRGYAFLQLEQYEEALFSYDREIEKNSERSEIGLAWLCRGFALKQLGQYDKARSSYERAIQLSPDLVNRIQGSCSPEYANDL